MSKGTDIADAIVKAAIFDVALNAVRTAAIANSPWLGLPVIKQIFDLALNAIGKKIYDVLSNSVDFAIITIQTDHEKAEYENSVIALREIVNREGVTQDDIKKARDELRARLAALIKLN